MEDGEVDLREGVAAQDGDVVVGSVRHVVTVAMADDPAGRY